MSKPSLSLQSPASAPLPPVLTRTEKIQARHLDRLAMVYVRQSHPQQMVRHPESKEVQYRLKLRAQALGWSEERIVIVDDDLGQSGACAETRMGFQRMVSEVSLDHVGIILGVETSRLARSCDDWYPLLKVCSVFGTLIGDLDGIYDPSQYNDRLLLGLKGTMNEEELHILKQRMSQGRLNKARKGELIFHVPLGYVRRPSGEVALDPDEQAREVVRLIFRKFEELGTLNATLQFLVRGGVKLPVRAREGLAKGDLQWHRPNRMTLQNVLKNPIYAGAYAYGRRALDPRRKIPGRPATGRTVVGPQECQVFLRDRLPAYISWDQYERNQERLQANRAVSEAIGAPKHGSSLLSGLLICGKCGSRMSVRYSGAVTRHSYYCARLLTDYAQESCQSMAGPPLDRFLSRAVLAALEPAALELSLEAARNIERQRRELDGLWQKRLERGRYEVERAAREYRHVEPENRLVVRELERAWEEKLRELRDLEEEHERIIRDQPRVLSAEEREMIRELAADVPALWNSPKTTSQDRKEILRQVIDRVVLDVVGESERVGLVIHWAGGTQTRHDMVRPVARLEQLSYWPKLSDRIRILVAQKRTAPQIAATLNEEKWRPPKRRETFSAGMVKTLIQRLGWGEQRSRTAKPSDLGEHEWWIAELARHLKMPEVTLYHWLRRGWIKARRSESGRLALWADPGELERLRGLRAIPHGHHTRRRWTENGEPKTTTNRKPNMN